MSKEIWKLVPSVKYFEASSFGWIKALRRPVRTADKLGREQFRIKKEKILSPQLQNGGYEIVHLNIDGRRIAKTVHSLVAEAFIGPRPKGFDVCHNNGIRTDNRSSNIRYDTRSNNLKDMRKHGTCSSPASKLSHDNIREMRKLLGVKPNAEIAKLFQVKYEVVRRLATGKHWTHVK